MVANHLALLIFLAVGASALPEQGTLNHETKAATDALWKAVGEGDALGTRTAVSKGADLRELRQIIAGAGAVGTALYFAALLGHVDVAVALISEGASVQEGDTDDRSPLHRAALEGQADMARMLLAGGADIEARDNWKRTALMWAALYDRPNVVKTLVAAGADIEARDSPGCTALYHAAWEGSLYSAMILVEHGADPNAKTDDGKTPLEIAEENHRKDMVAYLKSVGGTT